MMHRSWIKFLLGSDTHYLNLATVTLVVKLHEGDTLYYRVYCLGRRNPITFSYRCDESKRDDAAKHHVEAVKQIQSYLDSQVGD